MRGAHPVRPYEYIRHGIIPAYAGSTSVGTYSTSRSGDHPRVCGEHTSLSLNDGSFSGSSPRMRGAHTNRRTPKCVGRIIPAYAGSTIIPRAASSFSRGSSPRMRGARLERTDTMKEIGIIPAYAGSTASCSACGKAPRDHPRVCGEHLLTPKRLHRTVGSSPRMRGARQGQGAVRLARGIIPAYAGSTARARIRPHQARDHPRVCGEHSIPIDRLPPK